MKYVYSASHLYPSASPSPEWQAADDYGAAVTLHFTSDAEGPAPWEAYNQRLNARAQAQAQAQAQARYRLSCERLSISTNMIPRRAIPQIRDTAPTLHPRHNLTNALLIKILSHTETASIHHRTPDTADVPTQDIAALKTKLEESMQTLDDCYFPQRRLMLVELELSEWQHASSAQSTQHTAHSHHSLP